MADGFGLLQIGAGQRESVRIARGMIGEPQSRRGQPGHHRGAGG